jgi:hypothetical protein
MAWTGRKRLFAELIATALASPPLCALLAILARGSRLSQFLLVPVIVVAGPIARWINEISPPQSNGGWFPELGTLIITGAVVSWVFMWMFLMVILRLYDRFSKRKREL